MDEIVERIARAWGFDPQEILEEAERIDDIDLDIDKLTLILVSALYRKVNKLMADTSALEAAIEGLTNVEQSVLTAVTDLKDEIATLEAGSISQEKVDALTAKVNNAVTALSGAVASPEAPPAEEPPAGGGGEEAPPAE